MKIVVSERVLSLALVLVLGSACGKSSESADSQGGASGIAGDPGVGGKAGHSGEGGASSGGSRAGAGSEGGSAHGGAAHGGAAQGGAAQGGLPGVGGAQGGAGTGSGGSAGNAAGTGGSNNGGSTNLGGATNQNGGSAGAGCTGGLQGVQAGNGLCVAKTASITTPAATTYGMDATEVTRGQYDAWLATSPALPPSTDAACGWKSGDPHGYAETEPASSNPGPDLYPAVGVDWCDASAYCAGVGKHLCGKIGGGALPFASYADASVGEWFNACSDGGSKQFPYGTFEDDACNGPYFDGKMAYQVASLKACVTETNGAFTVYDLSGNVYEWENDCDSGATDGSLACRIRGGSFYVNPDTLSCGAGTVYTDGDVCMPCGYDYAVRRDTRTSYVGFRCCSAVN